VHASRSEDTFVWLKPAMAVPLAAFEAIAAFERLGHRVLLDGPNVVVEQGRGAPALDDEMLATLRRWKPHVRMLLAYTPSDAESSSALSARLTPASHEHRP
jgi:hypothetical protein